ncbi:hypothetical protein ACEYYA_09555 [Paracoccus sp. p3-h83]|uniref:hypothetical protein n=1 Tax=Paracoccus sp. p3-h83 TaxID=3342805 RepID=UPI0035B9B295
MVDALIKCPHSAQPIRLHSPSASGAAKAMNCRGMIWGHAHDEGATLDALKESQRPASASSGPLAVGGLRREARAV